MRRHRTAWLLGWCGWLISGVNVPVALGTLNVPIGGAMPDFTLPAAGHSGSSYGLEQLKGQPAVVVFWRPNQKLSLEALRDLEALTQELGPQRMCLVAIDAARSSADDVAAALAGEHLSFPILLDPQRELYGKVGVIVCPTTLVLDARGILQFVVLSHPPQFSQVVRARLQYLLGDIVESEMNRAVEPTVVKIDHDLAAAWAMYQLGQRLQGEAKSEEAIAVYEKVTAQYPSLPQARCSLGFMKLAAGDLTAAREHFDVALTYEPQLTAARLGQAAVLARTGQPRQAEHILLSLLGQQSNGARVRYELGRIYQARGETEKAATFFQDALASVFPEAGAAISTAPPIGTVAAPPPEGEFSPQATETPGRGPAAAPVGASPASTKSAAADSKTEVATPSLAPSDAEYVGVKQCKKCHLQQWKSWQETKMAKAISVLKPGVSNEVKQRHQLDTQKDFSTDGQCLKCHSTGFEQPGGYRLPAAGDANAAHAAEESGGVTCESCHGPGSKFVALHKDIQDKKRPYTQGELHAAGQFRVDVQVCAGCHDQRAPCIGSGYAFDFEQRKQEGTHKHFELQFRSK